MNDIQTLQGDTQVTGQRFGIVVGRFNDFITERLLQGAVTVLKGRGAEEGAIRVAWVPGAFEIPLAVQKMAQSDDFDAVIALGCVIRGGTPHFEYVAGECASGISRVMLQTGTPVSFGVLTVDNIEQAIERAGGKAGNKGAEAALSAIEMATLIPKLERV